MFNNIISCKAHSRSFTDWQEGSQFYDLMNKGYSKTQGCNLSSPGSHSVIREQRIPPEDKQKKNIYCVIYIEVFYF